MVNQPGVEVQVGIQPAGQEVIVREGDGLELLREVEQLITLAKRGDLHARRQALSALGQDKFTVHKLFEEVGPRYAERPGGYTRILKLGPRRSDSTEMVFIELV